MAAAVVRRALAFGRGEVVLGAAFEGGDGREEPVGAGLDFVLYGVVEDVGGGALAGGLAGLEGLAVAELEVHRVGAVADPEDRRRAVEGGGGGGGGLGGGGGAAG